MDYTEIIGEKLREIRKEKNLLLVEVEQLTDIPVSTLFQLERGTLKDDNHISKLCRHYGISQSQL